MRSLATTLAALVVVSACFETATVAAQSSRKLSGLQIREKFAGMQLTDEVHWRDVYDRDGTLRSYMFGRKKVGIWAVVKDDLCMYYGDEDDGCFEVWLAGERMEMKPTGLGLSIEGVLQAPTDRN